MNKQFERSRKNRKGQSEEDYYYSEDCFFENNGKKGKNRKDVGKRYHRKRTIKDEFWDDFFKYN